MATINSEACVIGGGIMGASTLYALSKRGIKATLIERKPRMGSETTARSGAIIRAHYGVPELVRLAHEANRHYINFTEEVGEECGFTRCGYSVLVDQSDVDALSANVAMHKENGVNVLLLTPGELADLLPGIRTDDVALAAFEPDGGYANPQKTVSAYVSRSTAMGAKLLLGQSVISAVQESGGWLIELSSGDTLLAEQAILCAGNWSLPVGKLFGITLPVTPVRAQIVVLERPDVMHGPIPVVSDLINLAYFRMDGESGMWVGSSDSADLQEKLAGPEGFNEIADIAAISAARKKAALRFTRMPEEKGAVQRAFCGLYETTPDWQPIIDSPASNLHVATGFSGHGFKLAPVIGEAMADAVAGLPQRQELAIFDLNRFVKGRAVKSAITYQRAKFLR